MGTQRPHRTGVGREGESDVLGCSLEGTSHLWGLEGWQEGAHSLGRFNIWPPSSRCGSCPADLQGRSPPGASDGATDAQAPLTSMKQRA